MTPIPPSDRSKVQRQALVALLLVFLPNLVLTGVGFLMRGQAQQVTEAQAAGHFGLARFLRQVGLNAFLLLPMGAWLWRRQDGWRACGWQQELAYFAAQRRESSSLLTTQRLPGGRRETYL